MKQIITTLVLLVVGVASSAEATRYVRYYEPVLCEGPVCYEMMPQPRPVVYERVMQPVIVREKAVQHVLVKEVVHYHKPRCRRHYRRYVERPVMNMGFGFSFRV